MRWMWIDAIVDFVPEQSLTAIKHVSLAEEHLHDHFEPCDQFDRRLPVMPGSLVLEAMAQTAGILVGTCSNFQQKIVLAKIGRAELLLDAVPGCTLRLHAEIERFDRAGAATRGVVDVVPPGRASEPAERLGTIELMFSNVDENLAGRAFPAENFVFSRNFAPILAAAGLDEHLPPHRA